MKRNTWTLTAGIVVIASSCFQIGVLVGKRIGRDQEFVRALQCFAAPQQHSLDGGQMLHVHSPVECIGTRR